ncbi:hypothetical protein ACMATS_05955 [Streptoverticillium reticulum]|uniref:hypothetical protein n=1 Tax=Streptoverticillium reticulum TaxID=1433415 RepID=UPI0039BF38E4
MAIQPFRIRLVGTRDLLHHSVILADPDSQAAKEIAKIAGKRKKTEDDRAELGKLEMKYGMYWEEVVGPYMPGENIERSLRDGGVITRSGTKIQRGVFIETDFNKLEYRHEERNLEKLAEDHRFHYRKVVTVQRAKVVRTRPIFKNWSCEAEGILNTTVLSLDELQEIATNAGTMIGIGDYRPRFGRYKARVTPLAELTSTKNDEYSDVVV